MNKSELIEALRNEASVTMEEARAAVTLFFDNMSDALAREDRIEIRDLCSFYMKNYKGYIGCNPQTGKKVQIRPKKRPFFKAGKELKELVDN